MADVKLTWDPAAPSPLIIGTESQSQPVRAGGPGGRQYSTYAETLAELDPPRMLENRTCYRLTEVSFDGGGAAMTFGPGSYFDGLNVGEAVAHELAAWRMSHNGAPGLADLPFRALVGGPMDLARRPAIPAISVLTLRKAPNRTATFLLHYRDAAQVAHAGGLYQVIPVGVFQPSSDDDAILLSDLDLWRCILREYGEEMLGAPEITADSRATYDYDASSLYRALTSAREEGSLHSYVLGVGVDPLSLATDILAVTVIDADVFDHAFGKLVASNTEGRVLGRGPDGFDFTQHNIDCFVMNEPMQAAGAAVLALAWPHQHQIAAV
jgi:hypothetical protein